MTVDHYRGYPLGGFNQVFPQQGVAVSGMIISAQYWPQLKETKLALPPAVQERFDSYTQAFQTVKGNCGILIMCVYKLL